MAVHAVKPTLLVHKFWLSLCCGSSTASLLLLSQAALAQTQPLSTDLQGYDRYLSSHQHLAQVPGRSAASAPEPAGVLAQTDLEKAAVPSPPPRSAADHESLEAARIQRLLAEGAAAVSARSEDVSARLHALLEESSAPQLLAQATPSSANVPSPLRVDSVPVLGAAPLSPSNSQVKTEDQQKPESLSASQIDRLLAEVPPP
ncbi:MAG: hypothetical protein HC921_02815 [Synechococcaceae cyanobacterium SM2_3_1]|nr:hypothetical protein [Synechococcaceae cyanobacterium SM2_3_1]